jgi:hypothetical protein
MLLQIFVQSKKVKKNVYIYFVNFISQTRLEYMPASTPSNKAGKAVPKGYTLHEPRKGGVPREVLQKRFEKLEKLIAKAKKQQQTTRGSRQV